MEHFAAADRSGQGGNRRAAGLLARGQRGRSRHVITPERWAKRVRNPFAKACRESMEEVKVLEPVVFQPTLLEWVFGRSSTRRVAAGEAGGGSAAWRVVPVA